MRILHYALGFPPYRSGGMTAFCMGLMKSQVQQGNQVGMLWPGRMKILNKKSNVKRLQSVQGVENFELINPLPVSLDEGISDIEEYTKSADIDVYIEFFKQYQPDVIHIHTLMGLHKEMIEAAKKLEIKTFFTTHDYFGICPKVTLFRNGHACENDRGCSECCNCNVSALSLSKIKIMQSVMYRILKDSLAVRVVRKRHRAQFFEKSLDVDFQNTREPKNEVDGNKVSEYKKLRGFYLQILEMIDCIHFNSHLSEEVYTRYVRFADTETISITHSAIKNQKKLKSFQGKLKIAYLAQPKQEKGFYWLNRCLEQMWKEGKHNFELHMFSPVNFKTEYIKSHSPYNYAELQEIMNQIDIVVVPSLWYETFGFTVLEALSYGVPVIITENVGAKDLLERYGEYILEPGNEEQLKTAIESLTPEKLSKYNQFIYEYVKIHHQEEMSKDIINMYQMRLAKK